MKTRLVLFGVLLGLVAACGSGEPAAFPSVPPGIPPDLYDAIVEDLTERLSETPAVITVTGESVTWNDASLGCPRPGELSVQVITPGYRLIFTVDGTEYDYRASAAGDFRLCV